MLFNSLSFRCKVIDLQPEEIPWLLFSSWMSSSQLLLLALQAGLAVPALCDTCVSPLCPGGASELV